MKKALCLIPLVALFGCAKKSAFDITPDQAKNHQAIRFGPGGAPPMDFNHLPPGAVKTEKTYKKGETLPDGRVADKDIKVMHVEFDDPKGDKGETLKIGGGAPGP